MWMRIITVHLDSLPGEPVRFEHQRRYKTKARCEAAALAELVCRRGFEGGWATVGSNWKQKWSQRELSPTTRERGDDDLPSREANALAAQKSN
jgi:hypothetical protein